MLQSRFWFHRYKDEEVFFFRIDYTQSNTQMFNKIQFERWTGIRTQRDRTNIIKAKKTQYYTVLYTAPERN